MANNEGMELKSSIIVPCKLMSRMSDLRSVVAGIPSLAPLNKGTNLECAVIGESMDIRIHFKKDSVSIEYTFDGIRTGVRRRMLVYLVSILKLLDKLYEVRFERLYTEIIDSLSGIKELASSEKSRFEYEDRIDVLNNINLRLYHRNMRIKKSEMDAVSALKEYKRVCYGVMMLISSDINEVAKYIRDSTRVDDSFFKKFIAEYTEWCKNAHE